MTKPLTDDFVMNFLVIVLMLTAILIVFGLLAAAFLIYEWWTTK